MTIISIRLENIAVGYQGKPVVSQVSCEIQRGEHVVIVGANGTGKSTLLRTILAFTRPLAGRVTVDALDPFEGENRFSARARVGFIQQRPDDQLVATSVLDEVAFGPENLGLKRCDIARRCEHAVAAVGLVGLEHREPHTLSGGQKQRLAIAAALAMEPDYLLCDEPTALLDPQGRREVLDVIRELVGRGVGVIQVTHDLSEAVSADRILVLADGGCVFSGTYEQLLAHEGEFLAWGIERDVPPVKRERILHGGVGRLALQKTSIEYVLGDQRVPALREASLEIHPGELAMAIGPTGSGKSTALRLLSGLIDPTSGEVIVEASKADNGSEIRRGLVFQDPESALFADTVLDDIAFGPLNYGASTHDAYAHAKVALETVGLDPKQFGQRSPFTLSGGEARRVALAGILALRPRYLLADEPTAALDALGRRIVRQILADASRDAGVIVVTHAPEEFISICDWVWMFDQGEVSVLTPSEYCRLYRPDLMMHLGGGHER